MQPGQSISSARKRHQASVAAFHAQACAEAQGCDAGRGVVRDGAGSHPLPQWAAGGRRKGSGGGGAGEPAAAAAASVTVSSSTLTIADMGGTHATYFLFICLSLFCYAFST